MAGQGTMISFNLVAWQYRHGWLRHLDASELIEKRD
jgi:hypothetical protein